MKKHIHNWIIPHEGNNHHPHALHHKHLVLHAVVAFLLKGVFVLSLLILPSSVLLASETIAKQKFVILEMTNAIRTTLGVPPLKESAQLHAAAEAKAQHMADGQYFAHIAPDGTKHGDWIDAVGYPYAVSGENLAVGFSTPQGVVSGWQKSPSHYANMIDPVYEETGVGVAPGRYKNKETEYIAQFFSSRKDGANPARIQNDSMLVTEQIDIDKSAVFVKDHGDNLTMDITTYTQESSEIVEVFFDGRSVELIPQDIERTKWVGQTELKKTSGYGPEPLVLATAVSKNDSGEVDIQDLRYEGDDVFQYSFIDQYRYFKENPSELVMRLNQFVTVYFSLLISLLTLALVFGIFSEMKKKHPHIILSSVGVILLLLVFIRY